MYANRRRSRGQRGKKLQRSRSEKTERTFAHVCETGGARRSWVTGIDKVRKRYLLSAAAHNLSVLMRVLFGMGTPKGLQQFRNGFEGACFVSLSGLVYRAGQGRVVASRLALVALRPAHADRSRATVVHRVQPG